MPSGRRLCEVLLERGVLAKETHGRTVRLAPPLVIEPVELDEAVGRVQEAVRTLAHATGNGGT